MQLIFSIVLMQLATSVTIMEVLRFSCSYAASTFCDNYIGGSFYCIYGSELDSIALQSVVLMLLFYFEEVKYRNNESKSNQHD